MFRKKKPDDKEILRQQKRELTHAQRELDRDDRDLERTEVQLMANIKKLTREGKDAEARSFAKQLV